MIDVAQQINAVRRELGTRVLEAGEARVMTLGQTYDTEPDDLWDACTNPSRIPRWFLPVSGELRLGGRFRLEGNAEGTIERCDPPKSFAATWEYGGEVSWIEVRVHPEPDGRSRFELEHVAHVNDELWVQYGPGAVGIGWDLGLLGLALHLSGGASLVPAAAMAWQQSAAGAEFMTESSDRWRAASVAAGDDEETARAAAARTIAAYTAAPESTPDS
ncbi:MAG TPA: SRPBCC family protein [Actinophytocola sp.]|jgi:uncharacterized protein YndB with AHSA1/START domain|nr:SRPBCC family protein [Actinophytocola sp.]